MNLDRHVFTDFELAGLLVGDAVDDHQAIETNTHHAIGQARRIGDGGITHLVKATQQNRRGDRNTDRNLVFTTLDTELERIDTRFIN